MGVSGGSFGEDGETSRAPATRDALLGRLTPAQLSRIQGISPRAGKQKTRGAILALTRGQAWRPRDLATLLNRKDVRRLSESYLGPMVEDGSLRRTHPETPTDPNQAYIATEKDVGPLFDSEPLGEGGEGSE